MKKFISVIIPTYSRPQLCLDAIRSVLLQSYTNFEITIVAHGKQNYISFLKEKIKDENNLITYFYIGHKYLSEARNFGAENSKGQWLAFLDDDDLWKAEKLAVFADVIEKNYNLDVLYSNFTTNYLNNPNQQKSLKLYNKFYPDLHTAIQFGNFVSGGSACAINKNSFIKIGKFDVTLGACEDHDLWRRAINNKLIFYFIDKPLTIYRKMGDNLGSNNLRMQKFEEMHKKKILLELPKYCLERNYYYTLREKYKNFKNYLNSNLILIKILNKLIKILVTLHHNNYNKIKKIYKNYILK